MRELNEKQLWLLRMLFEEEITEDEIQRYAKDNATNIPRWKESRRRSRPLQSRLSNQIGEGEIKAEPAVLQSAEQPKGNTEDEPSRDRRIKRKSKTN